MDYRASKPVQFFTAGVLCTMLWLIYYGLGVVRDVFGPEVKVVTQLVERPEPKVVEPDSVDMSGFSTAFIYVKIKKGSYTIVNSSYNGTTDGVKYYIPVSCDGDSRIKGTLAYNSDFSRGIMTNVPTPENSARAIKSVTRKVSIDNVRGDVKMGCTRYYRWIAPYKMPKSVKSAVTESSENWYRLKR